MDKVKCIYRYYWEVLIQKISQGEGGGGPLRPLGGFYLLVPRLIFGNISELIWCKSEFSETGIFTSQGFLICIAPHKPLASLGQKKKEGVDFLTPMTSSIPLLNNTHLIEFHCYMEILVKEKIYASCFFFKTEIYIFIIFK